jgi:hypothetical protein
MDQDRARDEMAAAAGTELDPEAVSAWFDFKGGQAAHLEDLPRAA